MILIQQFVYARNEPCVGICKVAVRMSTRRTTIDQRPGSIPEIRTDVDSVTFSLAVIGTEHDTRLEIRCDAAGEVWARITSSSLLDQPPTP